MSVRSLVSGGFSFPLCFASVRPCGSFGLLDGQLVQTFMW